MSKRKKNPTGNIGRLAMTRLTAYLLSVLDCPDMAASMSDPLSLEISCRKYQITASSVPRCTEVSNASP